MDGGGQQFVDDLALFRKKLNSYSIRAGISEEWDRPGDMVSLKLVSTPEIRVSSPMNGFC